MSARFRRGPGAAGRGDADRAVLLLLGAHLPGTRRHVRPQRLQGTARAGSAPLRAAPAPRPLRPGRGGRGAAVASPRRGRWQPPQRPAGGGCSAAPPAPRLPPPRDRNGAAGGRGAGGTPRAELSPGNHALVGLVRCGPGEAEPSGRSGLRSAGSSRRFPRGAARGGPPAGGRGARCPPRSGLGAEGTVSRVESHVWFPSSCRAPCRSRGAARAPCEVKLPRASSSLRSDTEAVTGAAGPAGASRGFRQFAAGRSLTRC